jgi:hypothetical protein
MFSIEPTSLTNPVDKPQMDILERYDLEPDPVVKPPPTPPSPATIEMRRVPASGYDLYREGDAMEIAFAVRNAAAGQTVGFWYTASLSESDFSASLAADFARSLPSGVIYSPQSGHAGRLTFTTAGTYSFTLDRTFVLDGIAETTDEAGWAEGCQEKGDFHLGNASDGLTIIGDPLVSNWVTDL